MKRLPLYIALFSLVVWAGCDSNEAPEPLPAPDLISPVNRAVLDSTTFSFSWQPVAGAAGYYVEVASDSNLIGNRHTAVTDTTVAGGLNVSPGTYFWRVSAISPASDLGFSSEIWRFQVQAVQDTTGTD